MLLNLPDLKVGYNTITEMDGVGADMLMDLGIQKMVAGDTVTFKDDAKETAILMIDGKVTFKWEGNEETVERHSVFKEGCTALHVCKGVEITAIAVTDAEMQVQKTTNDKTFASKLYHPEDCKDEIFGDGVWENAARRQCRTVFDLDNAPYSNMVLGELINMPGRWTSYVPHGHDQPEVYYYKFLRPEGFGAAFIGDDVWKIHDNSALCIPGGPTHPQCAAPGFPMWYSWMIRHLDGNPWNSRDVDPRYNWLLEEGADDKIWEE